MPRYEKDKKVLCAPESVRVCEAIVFIGCILITVRDTCVPFLFDPTVCGLSCAHQQQ